MLNRFLLVAVAMLAVESAQAADVGPWDDPIRSATLAVWNVAAAGPPSTHLEVGDQAPSFSYLGNDGAWHRSVDLSAEGAILLVFGAREPNLVELENARGLFADLGITPVIVMDRSASSARSVAQRLGITSPVMLDPKSAIGDLFNSIDPLNHRHAPSFFVLDEKRTIRALGHGEIPSAIEMLLHSARGLGRPLPESAWSSVAG